MIKPVHHIKILLVFLLDLVYRTKKFILYIWSGKHEFERICESRCDIYEKTMRIDEWLNKTHCERIRGFIKRNFDIKTNLTSNHPVQKAIKRILSGYVKDVTKTGDEIKVKQMRTKMTSNNRQERFINIEDSDTMLNSMLREMTTECIKIIKKEKRSQLSKECNNNLRDIIYRILCYKLSIVLSDQLAGTKYDSELHSKKLISLWNNLIEADKLHNQPQAFPSDLREKISEKSGLVSSRWSHIGFQGEDPGTDFRGMGLLGLIQLEYLSRKPKMLARDLLKRSLNEEHSYPFAIVGINITYNLLNLFKDGSMRHMYYDTGDKSFRNAQRALKILAIFNDLYVELYLRFDCFWHESKPENIFAFRELMEKFVSIVKMDLCNRNFSFKFLY